MMTACAPLLAILALAAGVAWAAPRASTAEYLLLPGHGRYKINANYKTWEAAKRTCEAEDAHLAVLDSEEEMDAVINMLVRCGIEYTRFDFWTGYYRQDETGQWTTVIGWPVGGTGTGYTGWMSGYPNGVRDAACSRLLLTINARGLINGDCTNVGPFICEKHQ
ncbi:Hemolymph lipopolysaccharide-binding protein [Gryllus bimaculatus]|nr:Hemolymph lipopolysaccharide-binding protein [Gryllus bimaculatus]